ncbi:FkbM family methyltransferase [Roseomonas sp. CAU 1739]|uniref:FkbM family methyltransferase n=1 Tax=Roseomonas sp. CAU 1739 TaxID=3140364 RepID=UPI00325A516E
MKSGILSVANTMCRFYFQSVPSSWGKAALWRDVVEPYLAWRPLMVEATTRHGLRFKGPLGDLIQQRLYFFGVWEPVITAYLAEHLLPGDIVVDVGANIGTHTLLAARIVGDTGRVHAIEASPRILGMLRANIARNGLRNVVVHHAAILDKEGEVPIYLSAPDNLGQSTVIAAEAAERNAGLEAMVPGHPLGDVVPTEDLLAARFVKIDVEGAEALVVAGIRDLLPRFGPRTEFLVEVNTASLGRLGLSAADLLGWFREAGFEPWAVPNTHGVERYITQDQPAIEPLGSTTFDLGDILFRRPAVAQPVA